MHQQTGLAKSVLTRSQISPTLHLSRSKSKWVLTHAQGYSFVYKPDTLPRYLHVLARNPTPQW